MLGKHSLGSIQAKLQLIDLAVHGMLKLCHHLSLLELFFDDIKLCFADGARSRVRSGDNTAQSRRWGVQFSIICGPLSR